VLPGSTEIEVRDAQSENASLPIDVTLEGMAIEERDEQPLNASPPIDVTLEGMAIETRAVHL
jgi:hypothetical protein